MDASIIDKLASGNGEDLLSGINSIIDSSIEAEIGYVSSSGVEDGERSHSAGRLDGLRSLKQLINETVTLAKNNK